VTVVLLPPRGLAPLDAALTALGPTPSPRAVLTLAVADRWMGDGARLIAAGEQLAAALDAAWSRTRGGHRPALADARRLIAQRCLYGIAPERLDVTAARRAITTWAGGADHPVFVDHAIRRGDADWMYGPAQLARFRPDPGPLPAASRRLARLHDRHCALRRAIHERAAAEPAAASAALALADAAVDIPRVIGDALADCIDDAGRLDEAERARRHALVLRWLDDADPRAEAELRAAQVELRRARATFHWVSEFSELYPHAWTAPAPDIAGAA
jgi:hypothetical protein